VCVRWATGTPAGQMPKPRRACPNTHCTAYQLQQSTSCHRACQRYIACQLSPSSLMMYRSPTATAYQLPQSLPAAAQLASGVKNGVKSGGFWQPLSQDVALCCNMQSLPKARPSYLEGASATASGQAAALAQYCFRCAMVPLPAMSP
jgi:hypothetical protein